MTVNWEDAPAHLTRSTVFVQVYGDTGTGRTTWALTAPGPIALIHASEKIEGIVQPFVQSGKKIRMVDFAGVFTGTPESIAKQAMDRWKLLTDAVLDSFTWARTTIIDTDTEAWQLIRLAYFGALKPKGGRIDANYGPVNNAWRSTLLNSQRTQDRTNLILIGQTSAEYRTTPKNPMGAPTGRTIRSGQKEVPIKADVGVRTSRDITDEGVVYSSTIEKGWWNDSNVAGLQLDNEMSNFPDVMGMVTNTDKEKWE